MAEPAKRGLDEHRFRRRDLPHCEIAGAAYFITFRLAGSLPAAVVEAWREEYERLRDECRGALDSGRGTHWKLTSRACYEKYDDQLDRGGHGPRYLEDARLADLTVSALEFYRGVRYDLVAYVVMPNHVHVVIRPPQKPTSELFWGLDEIMQHLKGYTGREANKRFQRTGQFWQREYFDHRLRDDEEWQWYVEYTHQNPVKAGLCSRPEAWQWSSAHRGSGK